MIPSASHLDTLYLSPSNVRGFTTVILALYLLQETMLGPLEFIVRTNLEWKLSGHMCYPRVTVANYRGQCEVSSAWLPILFFYFSCSTAFYWKAFTGNIHYLITHDSKQPCIFVVCSRETVATGYKNMNNNILLYLYTFTHNICMHVGYM